MLNFTPLNHKSPLYGEKHKIVEKLIFIVPKKRPDGKFSIEACPPMKGRTHIVISCPKKTKSFEENLLLIFQSSSLNRKLPKVGLF